MGVAGAEEVEEGEGDAATIGANSNAFLGSTDTGTAAPEEATTAAEEEEAAAGKGKAREEEEEEEEGKHTFTRNEMREGGRADEDDGY